MSTASPIRLVCFDLGGVIIRICRTWVEGLERAGLPLREGLSDRLEFVMDDIRNLVYQHQTGHMAGDTYYARFSESLEHLYTPDEVERVHLAWMIDQYAGVHDVVDALNRAGIVTAALSNTNAAHWEAIGTFSAVRLLGHRFASHLIAAHKPDVAAYEHVERTLAMDGKSVLFFDDLPENVTAASARGWHAVQIDHAGDPASQMRTALFDFGIEA